jgi:hypothetical protein
MVEVKPAAPTWWYLIFRVKWWVTSERRHLRMNQPNGLAACAASRCCHGCRHPGHDSCLLSATQKNLSVTRPCVKMAYPLQVYSYLFCSLIFALHEYNHIVLPTRGRPDFKKKYTKIIVGKSKKIVQLDCIQKEKLPASIFNKMDNYQSR